MTGEEQQEATSQEELIQARYHASLVSELKRLNASYQGLEEMTLETLEALKTMELKKIENAKAKPTTFQNIRKPQETPDTKEVKNEQPSTAKFNRLQVFHPQYTPIEKMNTWKENCTIFTMMVNPDPRFPEWQVS